MGPIRDVFLARRSHGHARQNGGLDMKTLSPAGQIVSSIGDDLVKRMSDALRDLRESRLDDRGYRTAAYATAGLSSELLNLSELERARADRFALLREEARRAGEENPIFWGS